MRARVVPAPRFVQLKSAAILADADRSIARTREAKRIVRPFAVKEVDDATGTFSGLAAAFSLDQGGDVIMPGAFKRTLADWRRAKGKTIPLIDTHNYGSARAIVGKMIEAKEVDDGLEATFEFIPDDADADAVRKRVAGGYVSGLSIGYEAVESRQPTDEDRRKGIWRYLKEVKLLEVSVVAFPMNNDARIDLASVKGFLEDLRARGIAPEDLAEAKQLHDELGALLATSAPGDDPAPTPEGLAPDDPKRLALEATARDVYLRHLGLRV
jgi:HK97 family phage prohead protease